MNFMGEPVKCMSKPRVYSKYTNSLPVVQQNAVGQKQILCNNCIKLLPYSCTVIE